MPVLLLERCNQIMNETDIRKYAGLMQELGLTGLEVTEGDKVVRLERAVPTVAKEVVTLDAAAASTVTPDDADKNYTLPACGCVLCCSGRKCRALCGNWRPREKRADALHRGSYEADE